MKWVIKEAQKSVEPTQTISHYRPETPINYIKTEKNSVGAKEMRFTIQPVVRRNSTPINSHKETISSSLSASKSARNSKKTPALQKKELELNFAPNLDSTLLPPLTPKSPKSPTTPFSPLRPLTASSGSFLFRASTFSSSQK
jgi:hypothetical protein